MLIRRVASLYTLNHPLRQQSFFPAIPLAQGLCGNTAPTTAFTNDDSCVRRQIKVETFVKLNVLFIIIKLSLASVCGLVLVPLQSPLPEQRATDAQANVQLLFIEVRVLELVLGDWQLVGCKKRCLWNRS